MLRVFVGSTFRDLEKEREALLSNLESALTGVGMEKFIPDGKTSQEIGIKELRDSDLVVFLISPRYGSLITRCRIDDCEADCPMKKNEDKISYTHCEYEVALSEGKPHQAYLVDKDWDAVRELKGEKKRKLDWRKIREKEVFDRLTNAEVQHYFKVAKKAWGFREEARREFCPPIRDAKAITGHLARNIVEWYSTEMINLDDFCGRQKDLRDLFEKMDESVEVYGVGGIGKTTLIHVALLLQKLKGKNPITVGTKQSYLTGSGYLHFREKCKENQHEIIGNRITLDDIIDALSLPDEVRLENRKEKIGTLLDTIERKNTILFIDDFHLADKDVRELVRNAKNVVTASRRRIGMARNELPLFGIEEKNREDLIKLITKRLGKRISDDAKEKIKSIAEGHPVSTEILVRNCEKINFQELEDYKWGLDLSNPEHVEEFLKRVVKEALSEEAFFLLKDLSVVNTDLENDLDKATIEKTYTVENFGETFNELLDSGMLKKKEEKEGIYQFSYRHIQEATRDDRDKQSHNRAMEYYRNKIEKIGGSYDDVVEILFHRSKSNPNEDLVGAFLDMCRKVEPVYYGFKRLIDVGEELRKCFQGDTKASISGTLGVLYSDLRRFDESEKAYREALKIRQKLAKKNPEAYETYLLQTQANIAKYHIDTDKTEEGINALRNVLRKRQLLPDFGAKCFAGLGIAYEKLENRKEASRNYFFASANYFLLSRQGVLCLGQVIYCLEKVVELADGEVKGDAELILTVIRRLRDEEADIPQVPLSERGEALKEALNGKEVKFQPENEIDQMVLILIEDTLSQKD